MKKVSIKNHLKQAAYDAQNAINPTTSKNLCARAQFERNTQQILKTIEDKAKIETNDKDLLTIDLEDDLFVSDSDSETILKSAVHIPSPSTVLASIKKAFPIVSPIQPISPEKPIVIPKPKPLESFNPFRSRLSSRLGNDFFKEIPKPPAPKRNFPVAKRTVVQPKAFSNQTQARDIGRQIRPNLAVLPPNEIKEFFINEFEKAYSAAQQPPPATPNPNTQINQPQNIVIHYHVNYNGGKRRRVQFPPQETDPERMSRGQKRRYYKRLAKEAKGTETL